MDPHDGRVVTNFLVQALSGQPLTIYGDGKQTRSFCYVDDLVAGLLLLADSGETGPVNLGNPAEMTINDFADIVARIVGETGREYLTLPMSDPALREPDISRARAILDWHPTTSLEHGLARTIEYLRTLQA